MGYFRSSAWFGFRSLEPRADVSSSLSLSISLACTRVLFGSPRFIGVAHIHDLHNLIRTTWLPLHIWTTARCCWKREAMMKREREKEKERRDSLTPLLFYAT